MTSTIRHLLNSKYCQFEDVTCSNECGKMLQRQCLARLSVHVARLTVSTDTLQENTILLRESMKSSVPNFLHLVPTSVK